MSGCPAEAPPADHHGDVHLGAVGGEAAGGVEAKEGLPSFPTSPPPPLWLMEEEEEEEEESSWSQDGEEVPACGRLERKWVLWHEFMKEQGHLEAWLQTAEQAVSSLSLCDVQYVMAKEELGRFERLLREARSRLVHLDGLTLKSRTLTRLFHGALRSRLRASVRGCGQRWDEVNAKLENITAQLKFFVSEWEEFEADREELELLMADLDIRLAKVELLTGDTNEKLKQLQSFQQSVCTSTERVNGLLQRGEALIQRCQSDDARHLEAQLLELLQRCSLVHGNIASTHARLLSMRLVFEDDWILSQAPDSGCPSESLLEEEVLLDRAHPDLLTASARQKGDPTNRPERDDDEPRFSPRLPFCPSDHHSWDGAHPPAPNPLSCPTHEHLGLEWDPSVDIGRSVSPYDGDSSYFSANAGGTGRYDARRRSALGSSSDVSSESPEADWTPDSWLDQDHHTVPPMGCRWAGRTTAGTDQLAASTPSKGDDSWPAHYDGGLVRAWLGVQNPEGRSSCSKAVQTDAGCMDHSQSHTTATASGQQRLDKVHGLFPGPAASHPLDQSSPRDAAETRRRSALQVEEETQACKEAKQLLSLEQRSRSPSPRLLRYFLATAVALLAASLVWLSLESPCHRSNGMRRGFHLVLTYVNGPPPT